MDGGGEPQLAAGVAAAPSASTGEVVAAESSASTVDGNNIITIRDSESEEEWDRRHDEALARRQSGESEPLHQWSSDPAIAALQQQRLAREFHELGERWRDEERRKRRHEDLDYSLVRPVSDRPVRLVSDSLVR